MTHTIKFLFERDIYKIDYPLVNLTSKQGFENYIIGSSDILRWPGLERYHSYLKQNDNQSLRIMASNITRSRYFLESGNSIEGISLVVLGAHQPDHIGQIFKGEAALAKSTVCLS